jgi:hypothetical protein
MKKNTDALVVASKEVLLEVTAYTFMVMSRDQNAGRSHNMKTDNRYLESVEQLTYLGKPYQIKILVRKKLKSRLKSGNACYHSVQNLLSSSSLAKNIKIKIYRTIILPIVLYGRDTWSVTFREERRLRVLENRVMWKIFGHKKDEVTG